MKLKNVNLTDNELELEWEGWMDEANNDIVNEEKVTIEISKDTKEVLDSMLEIWYWNILEENWIKEEDKYDYLIKLLVADMLWINEDDE